MRRLPRYTICSVAEFVLLALLAVQCARLVYAIVTPVGPLGEWRADAGAEAEGASPAILGGFDPFFRLSSAGGPVVVTTLDLKLFGIRADRATGRGSAIVGLPDGKQASYAVGEEILPGVTLKAVSFDGATVSRAGHDEQLFLDQSHPAATVAPPAPAPMPALPPKAVQ